MFYFIELLCGPEIFIFKRFHATFGKAIDVTDVYTASISECEFYTRKKSTYLLLNENSNFERVHIAILHGDLFLLSSSLQFGNTRDKPC